MTRQDAGFYNTRRYKLTLCIGLSVFFFAFLLYFQPFGVNNNDPTFGVNPAFLSALTIFASVTFLFSVFNEVILRPFFISKPSYASIIVWSCWTLLFLSVVNFFTYNILGGWHDFSFDSALVFVGNCSSVLVFPVAGTFFYFKYRSLQQHVHHVLANVENRLDANQLIKFSGQGSNDQILLSISSFQYARAQDNYVELYYIEEGVVAKFLIRTSLANLADSVSNEAIARCHRSYLVNLYHVKSVKGGSDLKLALSPFDTTIPVSKSYKDQIMGSLKALKSFR